MQYLSMIASPHTLRIDLYPGLKRPLHLSGLGQMLLTLKTDAEIGRVVRRYNAEHSGEAAVRLSEREVLQMAETARAQGLCQAGNLITESAGTIATLLPLPLGQRPLAVGIDAPVARLQARNDLLRSALMEAVQEFAAATLNGR